MTTQREQQRQRLAAEDDEADRAVRARADAARDDERNHPGHERERRHQDRPQPVAAGLDDRVVRVEAGLLQLVRVIDLQNRVLLDDAEQHQQAERREDVQRLLEDDDRQQRERQRQRQRQQNRDRVQPRLELRRQDQIHEDQRQDEREHEVLRRAPEFLRPAGERAAVVGARRSACRTRPGSRSGSPPATRSAPGWRRASPAADARAG